MPVLESACGCCTVNVGAKVLAWIDIVFYTLRIIGSLAKPAATTTQVATTEDDITVQLHRYQETVDSPMAVIPVSIVVIAAGVLLLIGLEKRNKTFLMPHLIIKGIGLAVMAIMVLIFLVLSVASNAAFLIAALVVAAITALCVYFWLWVYSVYQQLREAENGAAKYTYPQQA